MQEHLLYMHALSEGKVTIFSSASKGFFNIHAQTNSDSVIYLLTVYNYTPSYYWWSVVEFCVVGHD